MGAYARLPEESPGALAEFTDTVRPGGSMQCPACKRQNPDDARFCPNCGTRLSAVAPPEERKVVSILFCDLVDSTVLAGTRDPEEWRGTVRRYFSRVREEIERHGGTVEKFIGDAVMAVFGLPTAHEDDPERSVRAAARILHAVDRLGDIATRIGIATGEVVADPAAAEKGEFLVTGDAVNLASRLQTAAAPGTMLIDARTWRNVHQAVHGEARGTLQLKGFARPIEAWQVLQVLPESIFRGVAGLQAPLLGRNEELALLDTVVQRVRRDARATLLTVVGEAGVGKSRLFEEVRLRLPPSVRVLKGRCLPYGSEAPFSALADALKREAGIADTDPQEIARGKLHRFATGAFGSDPDAPHLTQRVVHALGLSEGEAAFPVTRGDLFMALVRLLASLAGRETVLVCLEDVHWADEGLLDFLADLTMRPPAAHLLLICLARPLLLERRPDWGGGRRNVASIYLDPLPQTESRRLLTELLKADAPEDVATRVLERAEGNPFFIEEILRMLIDGGQLVARNGGWTVRGADVRIPDTVQGVIAARLDQLAPDEKAIAQDAAVVGRIFWLQPLRDMAAGRDATGIVAQLERKELVVERPHSMIRGDREFIFRHLLIRDVAYGTIPRALRKTKHRNVADWLAAVTHDRPDEFADFLAYHYEQAQAWAECFAYTLRLGDRAYALDTYRQALAHYQRAAQFAEQVEVSSDDWLHLFVQRGWTYARLADYGAALTDLTEARRRARAAALGGSEVSALLGIAWVQGHRGDYQGNRATTDEALGIARRLGSPRQVADCLLDLGSCFHNLGQVHEALRAFDEAAEVSAAMGYERGTVHAMRGLAMQDVGQLQEAIQYHRQAIGRTREIGERRVEASNLNYLAEALIQAGAPREALEHAEAAKQLSTASGDRFREQYSRRWIALAGLRLGEFGRSLEEGRAALQMARDLTDDEVIGYAAGTLAELHATLGDDEGAMAYEQEALEAIGRVRSMMPGKGLALGGVGAARLLRGDLAGARKAFAEAVTSRFMLWGPPEGLWGLGMVAVREGAWDEAGRHAGALEALARPRRMRGFLARALWVRASAEGAQGTPFDVSEALALARESEELPVLRALLAVAGSSEVEEVTAAMARSLPDPELRGKFLSASVVRMGMSPR
jgi:class 3 adenylate cyclase/tetratricopeptide (TPR) repeat protein